MKSHLAALAIYLALSLVWLGVPLLGEFGTSYVGSGSDPHAMIWFLAWWPYAVSHRVDLFVTRLVWAPSGFNLAWTTALPGLSLIAAPLTLTAGPVVAYNVLALAAPALAAWTAYRLCRYVTGQFWPSLIGGYFFGFSSYELGQLTGHLGLASVALVPLAVYLVLRRLDGTVGRWSFVVGLALILVFEFLICSEVFATLTLVGGIAFVLAAWLVPLGPGRRFTPVAGEILGAYVITGVALIPYLYYVFAYGLPDRFNDPRVHSTDVLNFVVPTQLTLLGGSTFESVSSRFSGNFGEAGAYLGLPLLGIVAAFAWTSWRRPVAKLLLLSFFVASVLSLGPTLNVHGASTISLPWRWFLRVPLLNHAMPARFMLYAFLAVGVIVATWLATRGRAGWVKWLVATASVLTLLPSYGSTYWTSRVSVPPFFAEHLYRQYIAPGENILVLPYGANGSSMLWQVASGMDFRMAGGFVGMIPAEFSRWPIVYTLHTKVLIPDFERQLQTFLRALRIRTVVVAEPAEEIWHRLFSTLGVPQSIGGVVLYQRDPVHDVRAPEPAPDEIEMQARLAQFSALLMAAERYLGDGLVLSELTPKRAESLGLIPGFWAGYRASGPGQYTDKRFWTRNGLRLGPWKGETIALGMRGSYRELAPVIAAWGRHASEIYFPYPRRLLEDSKDARGELVMVFTPTAIGDALIRPGRT